MIYAKSIFFGLVMALAATLVFIIAVLYSAAKKRPDTDDGLTGVAVSPQMILVAVLFLVIGSGLMYWHLR